MVIESGIIIFIGFLLLVFKLRPRTILRMLGFPLQVDLLAAVTAYILHWGTFTGVMAAAVAGLMVSAMTSIGRKLIGYIDRNPETNKLHYHVGYWDILPDVPFTDSRE